MTKMWVNTSGEYQWDGEKYVEISNEGYWHDGEFSECKKDSKAPDYEPLAQASKEAAQIMSKLGYSQLDFAKQQYDDMAPTLKGLATTQQEAMEQQMAQGKDYYDYQTETFRPLEQGLVADAERFNTEGYREQLAGQAAADSALAFNRTRQASERAQRSMGVNPNSGAARAMGNQANLGLSANRAALMNNTRQRAEQMGWARRMDATGLGRNLAGASTAAYQSGSGAGINAGNQYMAAGNQYMAGMGQGANTIGSGQNMQIQGLSNVLNTQAQYAGSAAQGQGAALGAIGGAAMMMA